jgi:putative restriction endonuclease
MCSFSLLEIPAGTSLVGESIIIPAGNEAPETYDVAGRRTRRDNTVVRATKALYQDACQVCTTKLESPAGPVSDGAHIRPLSAKHGGTDTVGNLLCLCPNHHRQFDAGGIYISDALRVFDLHGKHFGDLTVHQLHSIELNNIRYHREQFGY